MSQASAHDDTVQASPRAPRRSGVIAVLICIGLVLAAVAPMSTAEAKKLPKNFFGLAQGGVADAKDYKQMHKAKVRVFRLTLTWRSVEPQRGVFNWTRIDDQIGALAKSRITAVPAIWGAPAWATGSNNMGVPPQKGAAKDAWKLFLKTAVQRYKKGGTYWKTHPGIPKRPVKFWQIWNEPNLPKYFSKPGTNPPKPYPNTAKSYAKFVKTSDKAIHNADKHAKVVLAGFSSSVKKKKLRAKTFLKKFLKSKGIEKHFDAAALHPYAPSIGAYKSSITKFRKTLQKGGAKRKPLWLTEVGWGSKKNSKSLNVGKKKQAKLLKKSFKATLQNRKKWKVDHVFWYDWRDPPKGQPAGCSFCASAGLLKNSRKHKPSYKQFKHFTKLQGKKVGHHHGHHHHH